MPNVRLRGVGNSVELPDITHGFTVDQNSGLVTVTNLVTTIVDRVINFPVGSLVFCVGRAWLDKGATRGITRFILNDGSGPGTILWFGTLIPSVALPTHAANTEWRAEIMAIGEITGAGDLTIQLQAQSLGSNSSVPANNGGLQLLALSN